LRALGQKDFLSGGAGDDTLYSGRGTNTVLGGEGNDYLQANGVASRLDGGNGNDTFRLAGKRTRIYGGPGDDLITAITSSGSGTVSCGPGNDTVNVSRFKGNARRVKISKDCEIKIKG